MKISTFFSKTKRHVSGGFSLIELLVVIGIFTLLTAGILISHRGFNSSILLGSLAYDVALSVRQAQVFGISAREFKDSGSATFNTGYGVHFADSALDVYILFADKDLDGTFSPGDITVDQFIIQRGNVIYDFCATPTAGSEKCMKVGDISELNITFRRPNPEATITTIPSGGTYSKARVIIGAPNGATREIEMWSTGQISVK